MIVERMCRQLRELKTFVVAMLLASGGARCTPGGASLDTARPDLGIPDDAFSEPPQITLNGVGVRNLGSARGSGIVTVTVIDSVGEELLEVELAEGKPVDLPAAEVGGSEILEIPIPASARFSWLIDSLINSQSPFGLRARIRTIGEDANPFDNVAIRTWRRWTMLAPDGRVTMQFRSLVPTGGGVGRLSVLTRGVFATSLAANARGDLKLAVGQGLRAVHLVLPPNLRHGAVFAARLVVIDPKTSEVLHQDHQVGAFDTVPPMLSNYRAVLFADGRVAIQVLAGDGDTGIPGNGVRSLYSTDQGKTWYQQFHRALADDFGRPALFEAVIGPFPSQTDLVLGMKVSDMVGNSNESLPDDAVVLAAAKNAELALDEWAMPAPYGSPVFEPASVVKRAVWADSIEGALGDVALDAPVRRFEARRARELRAGAALFESMGIHASDFSVARYAFDKPLLHGASNRALRIPAWR